MLGWKLIKKRRNRFNWFRLLVVFPLNQITASGAFLSIDLWVLCRWSIQYVARLLIPRAPRRSPIYPFIYLSAATPSWFLGRKLQCHSPPVTLITARQTREGWHMCVSVCAWALQGACMRECMTERDQDCKSRRKQWRAVHWQNRRRSPLKVDCIFNTINLAMRQWLEFFFIIYFIPSHWARV